MITSYRRFSSCLVFALAALNGLAVALAPREALAVTQSYCSFPSATTAFTYNQNAFEADNSVIRLTDAVANETGTAWLTAPLAITATTSFDAHFTFEMGPSATGGDGLAFVLQNSAAGATAVGTGSTSMGYGGITPSVVIQFNTFKNSTNDPNANNVSLLLNGSSTTFTATATPAFTMAGAGLLNAWVVYNAATGTIAVSLSKTSTQPATPLFTHALNLYTQLASAGKMYVGFTSATGVSPNINQHDVYELEFSTSGVPCACEGDPACGGATPACAASGVCATCSATNGAACTGATPVCNVPTNSCVGCLTNANCSSPKPICGAGNACRACTAGDCTGATPECATTGTNAGDCVACIADANCPPATPRCTATNTCAQCLSGADCGGDTPICKAGVCKACAADSDCAAPTPACEVWGACGQCSATNATQCTGGPDICDFPTGTCVHCEFNSDCSGGTPTCNTTTHTCRPCANNADCAGNPGGAACEATGMKAGSCVTCAQNSDCASAAAPVCDTVANECVQCLTSVDCASTSGTPVCNAQKLCVGCVTNTDCATTTGDGGAADPTPVCNPASSTCAACANDYSATSPGALSCPSASLPACQPAGTPLAGTCALCSAVNQSACVTVAATPVCIPTSATCGCVQDSQCAAGSYCDTSTTSTGTCAPGCRVVGDGGASNCATGEYCTQTNGTVGMCTTEPCNSNSDCKSPDGVCDTIVQPHVCVACLNTPDCPTGEVCDGSNHCVECTATQKQSCTAAGAGAACLASETCGCAVDDDCGALSSGRVCNTTTHSCQAGCRGQGGNQCPAGDVCSSATSAVGQCSGAPTTGKDATAPPNDAGVDAPRAVDAGSAGHVVTESTGCSCKVGANRSGDLPSLLALTPLALLFRRRRRSRLHHGAPQQSEG